MDQEELCTQCRNKQCRSYLGADVVAGSPNDLAKRMKAGYAKWAALFPNQVRQSAKGVE
jgi:hypothetical protein